MTPNEKALQLLSKHRTIIRKADKYEHNLSSDEIYLAKESSIISVNEVIDFMVNILKWDIKHNGNIEYWKEVKSELEKL